MSELVERHEIAALKLAAAFNNCLAVAGLGLLIQLADQGQRGTVLHGGRQPAQAFDGLVK